MSTADLKLSYKLTRDDYWSAQIRILRQGPWRVVTISLGFWMMSVLAASVWVMQSGYQGTLIEMTFAGLYAILGLTLLAAVLMRFIGRFRLNRELVQSDGGPLAPTTIEVGAEGINWQDGASQTWFTWSAFERIEVTEKLILLYSSPVHAIMIPRRVLGGEEAMLSFVGSARENIISAQRGR